MKDQSFSTEAEKIRLGLRKYKKTAFLSELVGYLHDPSTKYIMKMPGLCLVVAEWLFQVGEQDNPVIPSRSEVVAEVNRLYKLQDLSLNFGEGVTDEIAVRKLILSQLWYQRPSIVYHHELLRTYAIITEGTPGNWFHDRFRYHYDVELQDFLLVLLSLSCQIGVSGGLVHFKDFVPIFVSRWSPGYLARITSLIGSSFSQVWNAIYNSRSETIHKSELYRDTNFLQFPMIVEQDKLITWDTPLFTRAAGGLIRELFHRIGKQAYQDKYTKRFETYLSTILIETKNDFLPESCLSELFREAGVDDSKLVDYLISEDRRTVLIDAKGIEPHEQVMAGDNPKRIFDKTIKAVKAVEQGVGTLSSLSKVDGFESATYENRFLLIVTNLDFGFPNGSRLEALNPDYFSTLEEKYGNQLPTKNIFLVPISDFEGLCKACEECSSSIGEFLEYCAEQESDPSTKRILFSDHIANFFEGNVGERRCPIGSEETQKYVTWAFGELMSMIEMKKKYWACRSPAYSEVAPKLAKWNRSIREFSSEILKLTAE